MRLAWSGGEDGPPALLVTGAGPDAVAERLAVVPAGALATPHAVVPMAGQWEDAPGALRFVPSLPFARGIDYALVRRGAHPAGPPWVEVGRLLRPGAAPAPSARVAAIHPDVVEVPQNLLRLSVTFSTPMEEGSAAGRVRLEDWAGREVPQAVLPMPPELWDRQRRRLTVLLEPGRIKRGLVPNTALGAPLADLTEVDLVVDPAVRDGGGAGLVDGARRRYRVGPPVRSRVDPARWRVTWPRSGSDEPLTVEFERPLDHALALRCIVVVDERGRRVRGAAAVDAGDTRWVFRRASPWPPGGQRLRVDTALEDLAGNSVRRVFDRDLRDRADDPLDAAFVELTSDQPS